MSLFTRVAKVDDVAKAEAGLSNGTDRPAGAAPAAATLASGDSKRKLGKWGSMRDRLASLPSGLHRWGEADFKGGEGIALLLKIRAEDSNEWYHTLFAVKGRTLSWDLIAIYSALVCAIVVPMCLLMDMNSPPRLVRSLSDLKTPLSFSGTCLFFLLVFRNNNSYSRWWEGRLQWGAVTCAARRLARKTAAWVDDDIIAARIINWTACFGMALKQHLRGDKMEVEFSGLIDRHQIADLLKSDVMPLRVLDAITEAVMLSFKAGSFTPPQLTSLENDLGALSDAASACERIMRTPLPFIYVVHLRTIMAVWLLTVPIAMVVTIDWFTIPVSVLVGFFLIGLDDAACELENPFGNDFNDLPLDGLAGGIRANLMEIKRRKVEKVMTPAPVEVHSLDTAAAGLMALVKGSAHKAASGAGGGGLMARIKETAAAEAAKKGEDASPPGTAP